MLDRLLIRPRPPRADVPLFRRPALWLALAIVAGTFAVDILTPRGVAAGVIPSYLAVVIGAFTRRPGVPLALAALAGAGTIVGYFVTSGGDPAIVLFNRILVVASLLLFAIVAEALIRAWLKEDEQLRRSEDEAAEQARVLQSTGMLLRQFTDNSPSAILFIDNDRRIRFVNRQFCKWFAVEDTDVLDRTIDDVVSAMPGSEASRYLRGVADIAPGVTKAGAVAPAGGAPLRIESYAFTVPGPDGADAGYGVISRDVTELRQAEAELFQSQKMQAVGQLTGGLAHDFNNFLTIISGNLQLVLQDMDDDARRAPLTAALRATRRASDLTRRLLSFSTGSPVPPQRVEVNAVVLGLHSLLRTTLGQAIEIETELAADAWATRIDKAQLENALLNMTINARDAMPDGGRLLIATRNVTLDDTKVGKAGNPPRPGRYVSIRVADNGVGMAPDVASRVFEPFFTTKDADKGSGLGMTMVYSFIAQSGGSIRVDSAPGEGTALTILLPAETAAAAVAPPETAAAAASDAGGGERLLLVDDEEDIRALVSNIAAAEGYEVVARPTGDDALALIDGGERFDLLITDVIMPGAMDGRALARAFLDRCPDVPVLFISGYMGSATGTGVAGARMLPKPFTPAQVVAAIRDALDSRPLPEPAPVR